MASNETDEKTIKNKKILAINSGGTIGMIKVRKVLVPAKRGHFEMALRAKSDFSNFGISPDQDSFFLIHEDKTENIKTIIRIELEETTHLLDSADMSYDQWSEIAGIIEASYDDYDGFVVIHGTDTMVYGASALSFMFEKLAKPIVFTGAQIPMCEVRSDGWQNLVSSIIIAGTQDKLHEVTICFNNKVYRGNRCIKQDSEGFDAYTSSYPPLIKLGARITTRVVLIQNDRNGFVVRRKMEKRVKLIYVFPNINENEITSLWEKEYKGAVLVSYGAGNVPHGIISFIEKACRKDILIVNVSQCQKGGIAADYDSGNKLLEAGVVFGGHMTPFAALMKLSYILARYAEQGMDEMKAQMRENLRHELTDTDN